MMKMPSLVYQAISFYNAYIALEQCKPDEDLLLLVPKLVYGAFSVELIFKAILTEQDISYSNGHNLKVLFDKLPMDIQNTMWRHLAEKAPEYSNKAKRETELILMSEAFVAWRYCYERNAPAFSSRFLSAFANAAIWTMYELGYNVFLTESEVAVDSDEYYEINKKVEDNRKEWLQANQEKIRRKSGR